jgi:dihydroorotate dehydrogenase (NAD+) catalytic subunit
VTSLPIVGVGGVMSGRDALEFVACGANAVALGTVLFTDPAAPGRVREELAAAATAAGLGDPGDAWGLAHSDVPDRLGAAH